MRRIEWGYMRHVNNPPDASALMTSARSFGNYDLSSALADLLDNSIKARAHSIDIKCIRKDDGPESGFWTMDPE